MTYKFTINGKLPSLNEYINQCRRNRFAGAKFMTEIERLIGWQIPQAHRGLALTGTTIYFDWYEKSRRRDQDNVMSAKKYILDALVKLNVLAGDSPKHVVIGGDEVHYDGSQKVEVRITVGDC